jgi:hypothetical protein
LTLDTDPRFRSSRLRALARKRRLEAERAKAEEREQGRRVQPGINPRTLMRREFARRLGY